MGEPICRTLSEHGLPIDHCRPTTPFARPSGRPSCSARSISATKSVGACGEHRPLRARQGAACAHRERVSVARSTIERL